MIRLKDNITQDMITAPQTVTAAWADIGDEIDVRDVNSIALWVDLDINSSQNVRFQILAKKASDATDWFTLPLKVNGTTETKVLPGYYEFDTDADQKLVFEVPVTDLVEYVKVQVMAGTLGATGADIESLGVSGQRFQRKI